jgi:hypothetical protein
MCTHTSRFKFTKADSNIEFKISPCKINTQPLIQQFGCNALAHMCIVNCDKTIARFENVKKLGA